jgi:uncharacterized integral membrane protein
MLRRLSLALLFVIVTLGCAVFVRLNASAVAVDFYLAVWPATIGRALIAAFGVGLIVGAALAISSVLRLTRERRDLKRALKLAEGEIKTLRAVAPAHAR